MTMNRATGPRATDGNLDPVCGKELSERDPQRSSQLEGQLFFFCSRECKQSFEHNVDQWKEKMKAVGVES